MFWGKGALGDAAFLIKNKAAMLNITDDFMLFNETY